MKKKIVHEYFSSMEKLIDTMENRRLNSAFKGTGRETSQKIDGDGWTGTETYSEAMQVIKEGYKEPLEKMKKAVLKIGETNRYKRPRMKNDVVGFVPNVPNTLMNLPETMINRRPTRNKAKTIHLSYSFCASAKVKADQLIKGGINFIGLVNSLEKQGYRVKVDIIFISITSKTAASFSVNVKEYGQSLNLLKLTFPLVHPSMLRRIAFKWLETTPNLSDKDYPRRGYGTPLNLVLENNIQKETKFLKDNNIITGENSYYCNVYQAFQNNSVETLAKIIGLK